MSKSSWCDFIERIEGKRYSKTRLKKLFKELVSKDDYDKEDFADLLEYAFSITAEGRISGIDFGQKSDIAEGVVKP